MVVPVVRDARFAQLRPDRLNIIRVSSNQGDKYELRLQSFVCRELSQRINLAPGGGLGVMGRDICMEVLELGTVDLTLPQMQKLRDDLTREIHFAPAGSPGLSTPPPNSAQGRSLLREPSPTHMAPADFATGTAASDGAVHGSHGATCDLRDAPWDEPASDASLPGDAPPEPSPDTMEAEYPHPLFDQLSPEPLPTRHGRFRRYGVIADIGFWAVLGAIGLLFYFVDPLTLRARLSAWPDSLPSVAQSQAEGGATKRVDAGTAAPTVLTPPTTVSSVTPPSPDPVTAAAPASTEAAPPTPASAAAPPVALATPNATSAAAPPPPSPAVPHLGITVRSSCWVIVTDNSGTVYLEKLMKAGETWTVPPIQGLELRAGNAGATSLVVDGVTKPPLGADNALWTGPIEG